MVVTQVGLKLVSASTSELPLLEVNVTPATFDAPEGGTDRSRQPNTFWPGELGLLLMSCACAVVSVPCAIDTRHCAIHCAAALWMWRSHPTAQGPVDGRYRCNARRGCCSIDKGCRTCRDAWQPNRRVLWLHPPRTGSNQGRPTQDRQRRRGSRSRAQQ